MSHRDPLRVKDYLGHIQEAIARINEYLGDIDEPHFLTNRLVQDAVIRNLEIIGEAGRNIERVAPEFSTKYPELPLPFAYDMRNVLAHAYYKVDMDVVWSTVTKDLPHLDEQVRVALRDLG